MKKIFLLLIVFLLIIFILDAKEISAACTGPPPGVEIDGQCFNCEAADEICPNIILSEVYGAQYNTYCEDNGYQDPDCCKLISAFITASCSPNCQLNSLISMAGTLTPDCSAATYFQIDAVSSDGLCDIQYIGGDISGITSPISINPTANSISVTGVMTEGDLADCYGKTVSAWAAGLWSNVPGTLGAKLTGINNNDNPGSVGGSFTFFTPCSCSCGAYEWCDGTCGSAGVCVPAQRQQTRTCTPSRCATEITCISDSVCANGDADSDGLTNIVETNTGTYVNPSNTGTNPENPDSDNDGYTDGKEVSAGTDPTNANSYPTPECTLDSQCTSTPCSFTSCSGNRPQGTRNIGKCIDGSCQQQQETCLGVDCLPNCCYVGVCKPESTKIDVDSDTLNEICYNGQWSDFECEVSNDCSNYDEACENTAQGYKCVNKCLEDTTCCYCYSTCREEVEKNQALGTGRAPYVVSDCVAHTQFLLEECK